MVTVTVGTPFTVREVVVLVTLPRVVVVVKDLSGTVRVDVPGLVCVEGLKPNIDEEPPVGRDEVLPPNNDGAPAVVRDDVPV